jgi:hypothetical protein
MKFEDVCVQLSTDRSSPVAIARSRADIDVELGPQVT